MANDLNDKQNPPNPDDGVDDAIKKAERQRRQDLRDGQKLQDLSKGMDKLNAMSAFERMAAAGPGIADFLSEKAKDAGAFAKKSFNGINNFTREKLVPAAKKSVTTAKDFVVNQTKKIHHDYFTHEGKMERLERERQNAEKAYARQKIADNINSLKNGGAQKSADPKRAVEPQPFARKPKPNPLVALWRNPLARHLAWISVLAAGAYGLSRPSDDGHISGEDSRLNKIEVLVPAKPTIEPQQILHMNVTEVSDKNVTAKEVDVYFRDVTHANLDSLRQNGADLVKIDVYRKTGANFDSYRASVTEQAAENRRDMLGKGLRHMTDMEWSKGATTLEKGEAHGIYQQLSRDELRSLGGLKPLKPPM